jgi:hypothetical protein
MKSEKSLKLLDLDGDLPTDATDVHALRQARRCGIRDLKTYLDFLAAFPAASASLLVCGKGPAGPRQFEL